MDDILALQKRAKGWNSYDADPARPEALLGAVELINSFWKLGAMVPRPAVGLSPEGTVVLRWLTSELEVEMEFRGHNRGEYSVVKRGSRELLREGSLNSVDPLKDVVKVFVLDRHPQHRPWN
jgi:hypothetical protein